MGQSFGIRILEKLVSNIPKLLLLDAVIDLIKFLSLVLWNPWRGNRYRKSLSLSISILLGIEVMGIASFSYLKIYWSRLLLMSSLTLWRHQQTSCTWFFGVTCTVPLVVFADFLSFCKSPLSWKLLLRSNHLLRFYTQLRLTPLVSFNSAWCSMPSSFDGICKPGQGNWSGLVTWYCSRSIDAQRNHTHCDWRSSS